MIKINKNIGIYLLITAAVLLTFLSVGLLIPSSRIASAEGTTENADAPIEIATATDFALINDNLDKNYVQICDIDLSELFEFNGIGDKNKPFKGNYDGQRFKIKNLNLISPDKDFSALFAINMGTIKNIVLETGQVSGGSYVGAIAGSNNGQIFGCTNKDVKIKGNGISIGGIAGINSKGTISDCSNGGKITNIESGKYTGGICGSNLAEIKYCYNTAEIFGGQYVGGICGFADGINGISVIKQVYNAGLADGKIKGGLCGDNWNGKIEQGVFANVNVKPYSFNSGIVSSVKSVSYASLEEKTSYGWIDFDSRWMFFDKVSRLPILKAEYVHLTDVKFSNCPDELKRGEVYRFSSALVPVNAMPASLRYEVIRGSFFATIDAETGELRVNEKAPLGEPITIALIADGVMYKHSFTIVKTPVESVELSCGSLEISLADKYDLNTDIFPLDATNKDVRFEYDDEFVTIENGVLSLKKGCPGNYEFEVSAVVDGVKSNTLTFKAVGIDAEQVIVDLPDNTLILNPGQAVDLKNKISVLPQDADYKRIGIEFVWANKYFTSKGTQIFVDKNAPETTIQFRVIVDNAKSDFIQCKVRYPETAMDFFIDEKLLSPGKEQQITYKFYDGKIHGGVNFNIEEGSDYASIITKTVDGVKGDYLLISDTATQNAFTIKAKSEDGIELVKTFTTFIPVIDINISVAEESKAFCEYVGLSETNELLYKISPNTVGEETILIIDLLPSNATLDDFAFDIIEHEEIVQTYTVKDNKLYLILNPLKKTVTATGAPKKFIVKLSADDCLKTLIFEVRPIEVNKAVLTEIGELTTNGILYEGNSIILELHPDKFATDLAYAFDVSDLEKYSFLTYAITENKITVSVSGPIENEADALIIGTINGKRAQFKIQFKVQVGEISVMYIAENEKIEETRLIEFKTNLILPENASDKNLKYRVTSGHEHIEDKYLKISDGEYYLNGAAPSLYGDDVTLNEYNKSSYYFRIKAECAGNAIKIIAVAHNGIASDEIVLNINKLTLDNFEITAVGSAGITTIPQKLKQDIDSITLNIAPLPHYYDGEIRIEFPKNRSDWFDFTGISKCTIEGDRIVYTIPRDSTLKRLNDFILTSDSIIGEPFVFSVNYGGLIKRISVIAEYGKRIAPSISDNILSLGNAEYLYSVDVKMFINDSVGLVAQKTFVFDNNSETKSVDLARFLCFVDKDETVKYDLTYNYRIKVDANAELGINEKTIEFSQNEIIDSARHFTVDQANYWKQYSGDSERARLDISCFADQVLTIPQNINELYLFSSSAQSINTQIAIEDRTVKLHLTIENIKITGFNTSAMKIFGAPLVDMQVIGMCVLKGKDGTTEALDGSNGLEISNSNTQLKIYGINSKLSIYGGNGAKGTIGSNGSNGENGNNGRNTSSTKKDAENGGRGGDGSSGGKGGKGGDGGYAIYSASNAVKIESLSVFLYGGDGGAGGKGGIGGNGGDGGAGGSDDTGWVIGAPGSGGCGGNGGAGGVGGDGGIAGSSSNIEIGNLTLKSDGNNGPEGEIGVGGNGGRGGSGGSAGAYGSSGAGGSGGTGGNGIPSGSDGSNG